MYYETRDVDKELVTHTHTRTHAQREKLYQKWKVEVGKHEETMRIFDRAAKKVVGW